MYKRRKRSRVGAVEQSTKHNWVWPAYSYTVNHDDLHQDSAGTQFIYMEDPEINADGTFDKTHPYPIFAPISGKIIAILRQDEGYTAALLEGIQDIWGSGEIFKAQDAEGWKLNYLYSVLMATELTDGSIVYNELYNLESVPGKGFPVVMQELTQGPSSVLGYRTWYRFGAGNSQGVLPIGWRTRELTAAAAKAFGKDFVGGYGSAEVVAPGALARKMGGLNWWLAETAKTPAPEFSPETSPVEIEPFVEPKPKKKSKTGLILLAGAAAYFLFGKKGKKLF